MPPTLRELLEAPENARALPPEAMAAILGELVLLLARLLVMSNTSVPGTQQDPKQDVQEHLLTVPQAADLLGVRRAHIYALARRRELPVIHVGKYVRVRSRDLQSWIEDQREEGVDGRIQPGLSSPPPMTRPTTKVRGKRSR
jgi:excisionase family DNA binding protein